ncbi:FAD-binding oxidoreductase [Ruicaihuangia caeni]|uniref:FAD-binding oxidoreductase n=1 Tax=Ruicaihuangia caeni TaxID=3042517 RepID=UPI0033901201
MNQAVDASDEAGAAMRDINSAAELQRALTYPLVRPDDPDYAAAVSCFNLATKHEPDVVVFPTNGREVVAAVNWARDRALPIAVQATGHGHAETMYGGMLINTSRMQEVQIKPIDRTATVGAGVKWKSVHERSAMHGLFGLSGSTGDVGVVGYTLGGGLPVLGRAYGFAADRVRECELVTVDGGLHTVNAESDPELFELLRGGKGNLGIVTSMTFDLLPIGAIMAGGIMYPGADAAEVLSAFSEWTAALPLQASASVALLRVPDMPGVPMPLRKQFVAHLRFACESTTEDADALLAPMRAVSNPIMDTVTSTTMLELDAVHMDPQDPLPFEDAGMLLREFGPEAQAALLQRVGAGTNTPLLMAEVRLMGGALAHSTAVAVRGSTSGHDAITGRDAAFSLMAVGALTPTDAPNVRGALERLLEAMEPYGNGYTMVNFRGRLNGVTSHLHSWSPAVRARLARAKAHYDPGDLMHYGDSALA